PNDNTPASVSLEIRSNEPQTRSRLASSGYSSTFFHPIGSSGQTSSPKRWISPSPPAPSAFARRTYSAILVPVRFLLRLDPDAAPDQRPERGKRGNGNVVQRALQPLGDVAHPRRNRRRQELEAEISDLG